MRPNSYISHDLAEVAGIADRLAILYAGRVIEEGGARAVFDHPIHPYASALRRAVPTMTADRLVDGIPETPPPGIVHDRCSFADRCRLVADDCLGAEISLIAYPDRSVRCIHASHPELAPASSAVPAIPAEPEPDRAVLSIEGLRCGYGRGSSIALHDLTFEVRRGELVGLVGESGSGKSTLLRAIAGLHAPAAGTMRYRGGGLAPSWHERSLAQRRELQLIFQNPERSLNPRRTVGQIVEDAVRLYRRELGAGGRRGAVREQLEKVRLPTALLDRYPHQLSGGEKQRVAIARAFAAEPAILLCDEIVSALDVSVQAVIIRAIA